MPVNTDCDNAGELFAGQTIVETVRLVDYLEWIANKDHQNHELMALPPIQRSSLWKPAQIVDLWDSLLRGMPFGSFLVARMKAEDPRRGFNGESPAKEGGDTDQPKKPGFFPVGWPATYSHDAPGLLPTSTRPLVA